jgi:hypothetical protein
MGTGIDEPHVILAHGWYCWQAPAKASSVSRHDAPLTAVAPSTVDYGTLHGNDTSHADNTMKFVRSRYPTINSFLTKFVKKRSRIIIACAVGMATTTKLQPAKLQGSHASADWAAGGT